MVRRPRSDLTDAVGRVVISDIDDDPPSSFGPVSNPVDRFAHVPSETRRWIEQLRGTDIQKLEKLSKFETEDLDRLASFSAEDFKDLREVLRLQRSARAVGTFGKWAIGTAFVIFMATWSLGEKLAIAWKWITGGK